MNTEPGMIKIARKLRREMSPPEVRLWVRLRIIKPQFRRQHPLGRYVLDFYCHAARLVVEVDGAAHSMGDAPARDERRDAWLAAKGLRVVRIAASDVLRDPGGITGWLAVMSRVRAARIPSALQAPPPEGEEGLNIRPSNTAAPSPAR